MPAAEKLQSNKDYSKFRDSLWKYTDMSDHELLARTALACEAIALFLMKREGEN